MADISLNFSAEARGTPAYGDLLVSDGDLLLTSDTRQGATQGTEPIGQSVAQKMRTLLGEFFLDTSLGLPYYQELLGQKGLDTEFEGALQDVVKTTPGVVALLTWSIERNAKQRRLDVSFRAQTTTGQVIWSGSVNPQVGGSV